MKNVLDPAWNELRFGKGMSGSSDIVVMGLADLPEADRKRYEAMGFVAKPVERRVIKQEYPDLQGKPQIKTQYSPEDLTTEEYMRLKKQEELSDEEIWQRYGFGAAHNFLKWKKEHGMVGVRIPNKQKGMTVQC